MIINVNYECILLINELIYGIEKLKIDKLSTFNNFHY